MKTLIILLISLGASSAQNYFPSEVGNKYQNHHVIATVFPGGSTHVLQNWNYHEIIGDSIINGKRFVKFYKNYQGSFDQDIFYYFDEVDQKLYLKIPDNDTIRLGVDFNVAAGDSFISYLGGYPIYYTSLGTSYNQIWDKNIYRIEYSYISGGGWGYHSKSINWHFAEDIGLFKYETNFFSNQSGSESHDYALRSAIIDTTILKPITLKISSLYPLGNRRVNAFPFTLIGNFYTNLDSGWYTNAPPLIDEFYVNIIQVRNQDTIGIFKYPFNESNVALISLHPEVGDTLFLKAFISDLTIYRNIDTFPDSGYAEIIIVSDSMTAVESKNIPTEFKLHQNYPNPFNPLTTIEYSLPSTDFVTLTIYDVMGNLIFRAVNEQKQSGSYSYEFNGSGLSSGVYFYRLTTRDRTDNKKMIMMK